MYVCTHIVSDCASEEHTGSLIPLFSLPSPSPSFQPSFFSILWPTFCSGNALREREEEKEEGRKGEEGGGASTILNHSIPGAAASSLLVPYYWIFAGLEEKYSSCHRISGY